MPWKRGQTKFIPIATCWCSDGPRVSFVAGLVGILPAGRPADVGRRLAEFEHVDEIQAAVRALTAALDRHEDSQALVNQWLTVYGGGKWRLVSIVGKRTRKEGSACE